MKIVYVCAWCKKIIRFEDSVGGEAPTHSLSHGICQRCREKMEAEMDSINPVNNQ